MRLIDADALCKYVAESKKNNQHIYERERLSHNIEHDHFMYMISMAPDIDAEPVRHGRWIQLRYGGYVDGCLIYDEWECSECQYGCEGEEEPPLNYCPECGAKMDGGKENDLL